jgi:hypothetical protein
MNNIWKIRTILTVTLLSISVGTVWAIPPKIGLQGRLTGVGAVTAAAGTYSLTVKFYREPLGGTPLWTSNAINVPVDGNGVFYAELSSGMPVAIEGLAFDAPYYLEFLITPPGGGSPVTIPVSGRARPGLSTAAYTFLAKNVTGAENFIYAQNTARAPVQGRSYSLWFTPLGGTSTTRHQPAVYGEGKHGVRGKGTEQGVSGDSTDGDGVIGKGGATEGTWLSSDSVRAVGGVLGVTSAVSFNNYLNLPPLALGRESHFGVAGLSQDGNGVYGMSASTNVQKAGVYGYSLAGRGVMGWTVAGYGIYGQSPNGYAGGFSGGGVRISRDSGCFLRLYKTDSAGTTLPHSWGFWTEGRNVGRLTIHYSGDLNHLNVITLHPDGKSSFGHNIPKSAKVSIFGKGISDIKYDKALAVSGAIKVPGDSFTTFTERAYAY